MTLALGIDIGTSGIRTAVLDESGTLVSSMREDHVPQDIDRIDADLWWQAVKSCLKSQVNALKGTDHHPSCITRIAVDGTSGSMVLTDAQLQLISRALMYNSKGFDIEAKLIAKYAPKHHITQGANSALARAMRLASETEIKADHLLHQADFIAAKLTCQAGLSDHNNSLKTGYDPEAGCWPDWIEAVIDPKIMPKVFAVGTPIKNLDQGVAKEIGLTANTLVCAGTTDSIAAFLAAAPLEMGISVTSLGSTLAVKMLSPYRIDDHEIGLYSHKLGDAWLVGGASNTGGAVLLEHFTPEQMIQLSAQIDPSIPTGLDYYPLVQPGERFPINDPDLEPRIAPRPGNDAIFLQALLEGIAKIEAKCYREVEARTGVYPKMIFTAGGGARNNVWSQIRAQALRCAPLRAKYSEAAIGAAKVSRMGAVRQTGSSIRSLGA